MKDTQSNQPSSESQINRRCFLKTASVAAVGGSVLGGLAIERSAFAAPNDTLKIALIGCGGRGTGAADQALSTKGGVKLVAMAEAFEDKLTPALERLKALHPDRVDVPPDRQFVGFDAYQHAIAAADVVILATPPGFRPIHFEAAVNAGKHVFMEKPVAVDAPGVRQVLAAAEVAKQKNLKVGVGLQRHHQAGYIEAVKRLQEGAIGDIEYMRCYWNGQNSRHYERKPTDTEMQYQMRIWYFFTWLCGDHICEQHVHNLDIMNWVKNGYPVRACGMGGRQVRKGPQYGQIWDHHAVEYEYADGTRMFSQCRQIHGCWNSVSEHALGTKGLADMDARGWRIKGENHWQLQARGETNPYQKEHDDLFAAIRNNEPYNEAERGAKSTLTAIMGRLATYTGQIIEWDHLMKSKISLAPKAYTWDTLPQPLPDKDGLYPIPVPGDPASIKQLIEI